MVSSERVEKRAPLVDDFIGREGKVLSYETFMEQNEGLLLNALTYIGYCRAIPPTWKRLVTNTDRLSASERERIPTLVIKGKDVVITLVKPSFFNDLLVEQSKPTAQQSKPSSPGRRPGRTCRDPSVWTADQRVLWRRVRFLSAVVCDKD